MQRTRKHNKNLRKTRKGGMNSKPVRTYPPLPESPTNRKSLLTNNESLIPPKKNSEEYIKRRNRLMKTFSEARHRTLMNRLLGRKLPEPKLNSKGYPKSFFTVNNKVGFKP